jgi:two-component system sensor histidine kinase DegS
LLRQREADLRKRRDEVERTILNMKRLVERSEQLLSKMGMAMRMLTGSWSQADEKMKQLDNWQHFGAEIITAQEEERQRIARDLHDGPVQTLAGISMRAEFCQKLLELASGDLTGELVQLQQLSREAIADLRKIIFDLRPMSLDDLGLVPALSRMFERLERNNSFRVDFVIHGNERRLDSSREVAIYRIIQEALNNVQKHAEVNNATVKMEFLHKSLRVQIRDLGCGFNVGKIADDYHGLLTMRERATLIGAELTIKAQPQKGTIVELLVKE